MLVGCLLLGLILSRLPKIPPQAAKWIATLATAVSLPALALLEIHRLKLNSSLLWITGTAWLCFILAWLAACILSNLFKWDRATRTVMILTMGLGNTSFLGFPLIEHFYGPAGLPIALMYDQPGSFLILSTFGIILASEAAIKFLDPDPNQKLPLLAPILKRVFTFPPLWGVLLGITLHPWVFPSLLTSVLNAIGSTLAPLSLIAIGMQLHWHPRIWGSQWKELTFGLGWKLIAAPALAWGFLNGFHIYGINQDVAVIESGMAPMATAVIIAQAQGLRPELATSMLAAGVPLSLLTTEIWHFFLRI